MEARETLAGRPPTEGWKSAAEWSEYSHRVLTVYLDPGRPLPAKLLALPEMAQGYAYLQLEGEDSTPPNLALRRLDLSVTQRGVPRHLLFPRRHAGWWVILGGVLIYALFPWSRPAVNQFCPIAPGMAFRIDLVGVLLYGAFLGIWSNLILEPSIPGHGQWSQVIVFTIVFWGMALSGVAVLAVALWYITFRLQWDHDGLRSRTLLGESFLSWEEIRGISLEPVAYRFAKRIRVIGLLLSMFNWRMAGPSLLMQTESVGLHLATRDGDGWRVDLGNFSPQGLGGLVDELTGRGILVSPELVQLRASVIETKHALRLWPIYLAILGVVSLVAYAIWRTMPPSLH